MRIDVNANLIMRPHPGMSDTHIQNVEINRKSITPPPPPPPHNYINNGIYKYMKLIQYTCKICIYKIFICVYVYVKSMCSACICKMITQYMCVGTKHQHEIYYASYIACSTKNTTENKQINEITSSGS